MGSRHRGLQNELSALLGATQDGAELPPPNERTSAHLGELISRGLTQGDDARTVYEFLPLLMLRLFGFSPGQGWLETAAELPTRDREALLRVVLPNGPIHAFCNMHSPPRASPPTAMDLRFEFPHNNLPVHTVARLKSPAPVTSDHSVLAPLLRSSLRNANDSFLLLSPIDYFVLCMVSSPVQKITIPAASLPPGAKRPRRSSSLPSTRALYNQVLAAYAASHDSAAPLSAESSFVPACIDLHFMPFAVATSTASMPVPSTNMVDAMCSVMLALVPPRPSTLKLDSDFSAVIDWGLQTNASALYRAAGSSLTAALMHYDTSGPTGTLVAFVRLLALFIAPWKLTIRSALRAALYPKPRSSSTTLKSSTATLTNPSIAAITSTWSSINAHLSAATVSGSPGNASTAKESQWRSELASRQRSLDIHLIKLAVVKAANCRLASTVEGVRALGLLSDAVRAAGLKPGASLRGEEEESRGCLHALRDQAAETEHRTGQKGRNFSSPLAVSLGVRLENVGVFSGVAEMVGVGGSAGMAGMVGMVSGASTGQSSHRWRLRERRTAALQGSDRTDVPFLGSVWDRPIARGENEALVLAAYWLALRFEPALGYQPDLRFLGRYWVWILVSFIVSMCYAVLSLVRLGAGHA